MAKKTTKKTTYAARSGGKTVQLDSKTKKAIAQTVKKNIRKKNGKLNWPFIIAAAVLLAGYLIIVFFNGTGSDVWEDGVSDLKDSASGLAGEVSNLGSGDHGTSGGLTLDVPGKEIRVHFIDVDQGDCILIEDGRESVLIDAGENDQGEVVLAYLDSVGVEKIDIAVGTHPHSDHIGGMDTVMKGIKVGELLMSDVPDSVVPTTRTYESVLEVADDKNIDISFTYPGDVYEICGGRMTVLGPVEDFTDLNDESLVIRFDYGENSFVFTGDQEIPAEEALLATDPDLDADVLKMGHHGSSTSTCPAFWEAVSPEIAVIQCGVDNDYGHPHREIRALLNESGIDWYRTDEQGSIIITGDGSKLTVETVGKVVTD